MKSISKIFPLIAATTTLAIAADENTTPEHDEPNPVYEELVTTSSRIEQPLREVATAMTVITRDDLDVKGYNSLAAVLRNELSIGASSSGGVGQNTAVRIRGEEGYRTLLLIDGVDVSDASGTQKGPQFQNIASSYDIERIEILRGPQGFMYGADAGGVINIITAQGTEDLGGKLTAETGAFGTRNTGGTFYVGNERSSLSASFSHFETDGINVQQADTVLRDKDGSKNQTAHLKGYFEITDNLNATLVYRNINLDYDYDGCFDATTFTTVHNCNGINKQENARLSLAYELGQFDHEISFSDASIHRDSFTGADLNFAAESDSIQAEYLGSWSANSASSLVYGLDYEEDEMSNNFGALGKRDQIGLFGEYQISLDDNLFLTFGLRHDDNSDFGEHTSGRVSAAYVKDFSSGSSLKLRTTSGTGFRAPSMSEISYNNGPTQYGTTQGLVLSEELSRGFDIGADWFASGGWSLGISYFDQKINDEIYYEFNPITFEDGYLQGEGVSTSKGVELSTEIPVFQYLTINGNFTFNETEDSSGEQRVRRPEKLGNLSLTYQLFDQRLKLLGNIRFSKDATDNFAPLPDYNLVDLSANYSVSEKLDLFARVENLTDKEYIEINGFNAADRSAYLGARVKF